MSGGVKLTPHQAVALRRRYAQGDVGYADLAEEYDVHTRTIAVAVTGQTWKQLPGAVPAHPKGQQIRSLPKTSADSVLTAKAVVN
jgi:hypothetical protein